MQDRPTTAELLDAIHGFLEHEVLPAAEDGGLRFRVLVAMNLLRVASRDGTLGRTALEAEWRRQNRLAGRALPVPPDDEALRRALLVRRAALVGAIRAGAVIPGLHAALEEGLREQLRISNPRYLATFEPV